MNKIILILVSFCTLFAERTEVLFHLHDAGETYALLPVIRELERDYLIVTTGVAGNLLTGIPKERIRSFDEYKKIEPKEVVTGVASELQGELLDYFRSKGVITFAFWDNFNFDGMSPYFRTAHSVEPRADLLLLPCEALVEPFSNRAVRVVGHPTLEQKSRSKIALWIGGYGKDYDEAYELFQNGMKGVEGVAVICQHHPKTGLKNDLKLVDAMAIADLVICHQSTAAFQALAAGKPVLHVIPENQYFESLPLQKGLAKKVSSVEEFPKAIRVALESDVSGFFELMGIPEHSTESCKAAILENL